MLGPTVAVSLDAVGSVPSLLAVERGLEQIPVLSQRPHGETRAGLASCSAIWGRGLGQAGGTLPSCSAARRCLCQCSQPGFVLETSPPFGSSFPSVCPVSERGDVGTFPFTLRCGVRSVCAPQEQPACTVLLLPSEW